MKTLIALDFNFDFKKEILPIATSTPTPKPTLIIKPIKEIEVFPLTTSTPTAIPPTATPTPTAGATPEATATATTTVMEEEPSPTGEVVAVTDVKTEITPIPGANNNQQSNLFLGVIIGLLLLIILIQIWPKIRKKGKSDAPQP